MQPKSWSALPQQWKPNNVRPQLDACPLLGDALVMRKSTVWIIGSGFSKSLGGPLLNDLLSERSGNEARARLIELASAYGVIDRLMMDASKPGDEIPNYHAVYEVFAQHLRGSEESKGKAVHWENAEEFLTFVDSTSDDAARREILRGWLHARDDHDVGTFRRQVVRAIATECQFVQTASVKNDEAWSPYIRWANRLDAKTDAIITFNYDLVLETLGDSKLAPQLHRRGVASRAPGTDLSYVPIYKLHGSVDWYHSAQGEFRTDIDFLRAINSGLSPLIGTPGIGKRAVRDRFLGSIWNKAWMMLQQADVIVFLGYRSPPSDPDARTFILDGISTPEGKDGAPRHRRVHLVLGPNTSDPPSHAWTSSSSSQWQGAGGSNVECSASAVRNRGLRSSNSRFTWRTSYRSTTTPSCSAPILRMTSSPHTSVLLPESADKVQGQATMRSATKCGAADSSEACADHHGGGCRPPSSRTSYPFSGPS